MAPKKTNIVKKGEASKDQKSADKKQRVVLLDSHAIIHRAYHALPDFASSSGEPTGALYGLSTMLMSLIKEFKPDHIIAAFDLPKPTYRHEAYADYKSGRKETDSALRDQIIRARDVFKAFNIPIYEMEGYEADDVIGTLAERLKKDVNTEVIIASGDMDTLQLVDGKQVVVFTLRKGIKDTVLYDEKAVKDRFGFKPEFLTDYKGLRGDTSDNIIGIPGIGEKTATTLLTEFGTIENLYKKLKKDESQFEKRGIKKRIVELLKENEEEALFSKMLATIKRDVPLTFKLSKDSWREGVSAKMLTQLFTELEFRSLVARVPEVTGEAGDGTGASPDGDAPQSAPETIDPRELKEAGAALWVLNSSFTNPTREDILHFAKTDDFAKAKEIILNEVKKQGLEKVYDKIELPLIPILETMKENGIMIDVPFLKALSKDYHKQLTELEKKIWKECGEEFNINSPKQMAEVLFTKMELKYKGMRKTSSGSYSTKEEVLKKLAEEHEIANTILEYRELQKLLSTYIDTIPELVEKDKRLHPTFLQAGAATGRMASENPNVQNIPTRSELGRKIRNAFIAPKDARLVAFDYSQIELRIAAFLSGDEKFIEIFKSGEDVHTSVAAYVFKVQPDDVTKEMRSKAKVINFGILYGMGVNALQKNLKTDRKEAQEFYNDYFATFTGLVEYLEKTKADAGRKGYTETLFGRRRYFEGINSKLPFIRAQAERMAINAPIQGTSADITKIAMVEVYDYLQSNNMLGDVKPLLQIHDELIYEIKTDIIEDVAPKIQEIMESVVPEKDTKGVPIIVNASAGPSWGAMKTV